ncbi:MAG: YheV family putative metal-binding protein [Gammaproteobacteria bacterium]
MKLRFIAGATCPKCQDIDCIKGELHEGQIIAASCVSCDWQQVNPSNQGHQDNHAASLAEQAVPVRILDPNADPSDSF